MSGSGYSVEQITNRVVSGDFDEDGYHDDIAVFYQDWNPGENRINLFKNNGASGFTYNNHFWPKSADYDFSKVSGLIVSGNFNQDSYQDDIVAFFDYGQNNLRSHVWVTKTGVLEQVNEELGYPWLTNVLY